MKFIKGVSGGILGVALCLSSTVASAAALPANYSSASISPFVALSAYGTMQSRSAVCAAAAGAAAATALQTPAQGCVLPLLDPAPVVVETAPIAGPVEAPVAFVPAATGFGFGIGALFAGLVLVAGLAAVLLSGNGDDGRLPISPD